MSRLFFWEHETSFPPHQGRQDSGWRQTFLPSPFVRLLSEVVPHCTFSPCSHPSPPPCCSLQRCLFSVSLVLHTCFCPAVFPSVEPRLHCLLCANVLQRTVFSCSRAHSPPPRKHTDIFPAMVGNIGLGCLCVLPRVQVKLKLKIWLDHWHHKYPCHYFSFQIL